MREDIERAQLVPRTGKGALPTHLAIYSFLLSLRTEKAARRKS